MRSLTGSYMTVGYRRSRDIEGVHSDARKKKEKKRKKNEKIEKKEIK
jgi:hypothetical protein